MPVRSRLLAPLLAAALVSSGVAAGEPAVAGVAVHGSDGIGDAYFPLDGNGGIDVVSYRIQDRYRFRTGRLIGTTRLRLRATQDLDRFDLDFLLNTRSVTVAGEPATFAKVDQHELQVTPATPLAAGDVVTVRVAYAGYPGNFSYAGESNWLADGAEVVAMNQPHMAPWWFPSNDHPSDKALMDIAITVPRDRQVIANGERVSRHRDGPLATTRWRAEEPMATYLAFFAAGRYAVRQGVTHQLPWLVAVNRRVPQPQRTDLLDLLGKAPDVVHQLADDLGPYPFSWTGGLATHLDPGFALENQTRPTYPADFLSSAKESLLVHELAHQWFGDSVALERWQDIWLNEGAATFMERRWAETHGGETAAHWLRRLYDGNPAGSDLWKLPIGDPGAGHIFAPEVYYRGAMALQALRNRLGGPVFWALLQAWLSQHEGSTGTTAQFRDLAEEVSGEDLTGFFDAWLFSTTRPADTTANGLG